MATATYDRDTDRWHVKGDRLELIVGSLEDARVKAEVWGMTLRECECRHQGEPNMPCGLCGGLVAWPGGIARPK